jgi:FlaA1/EpsC-like NDP-sugar epimerase
MSLSWLERSAHRAARFPRWAKVLLTVTADAGSAALALLCAVLLRGESFSAALDVSPWLFLLAATACVACLFAIGVYRAVFRFITQGGLLKTTVGVVAAAGVLWFVNENWVEKPISGHAITIFALLTLLYMFVSRSLVRELLYFKRGAKERVVIYGAGSTGARLARALRESGQYLPVAFVDDDSALQGRTVSGIKVHRPKALPTLLKRHSIASVLLAVPSYSRRERQAILKSLEAFPVSVRTVPDIDDIMSGQATVTDLRDVDANDLLGRDPVAPNEALLDACIRNKVVMVSGAGGSIGSELCRQILRLAPRKLILLEISEVALYSIESELRSQADSQGPAIIALLGNALHLPRLREVMQTYGVQTVYHAAAYKHVPIVEQNVIEGIHNNVFSTWCMAEAALDARVETFVLISTDKAVNPTNVMGASKRLAELTLQALQERSTSTRFCMVRFGNVLESSGSVVPLFREQIKRGGPVTVTHRDVIRYFMTIPEAVQLVLQAGSMAQGGDVFVLDMGEPVRILDLARRMIHLMGATIRDEANPEGDIEIQFTGLRPGEKLYEELLIGSNVTGTDHPRIMRADEPHLSWKELKDVLATLRAAIEAFDCEAARELILKTVAEYRPSCGIQDLVWQHNQAAGIAVRPRLVENRAPVRMPDAAASVH